MAKINCARCKKQLGFLSIKHKTDDGLVVCDSCINRWKMEKYIEKIKKKEKKRKRLFYDNL